MYHGVTVDRIVNWTQIPLSEFSSQMKYIVGSCRPVSIAETVEILSGRKKSPSYAVAVTFDDGFKNNYTTAYPVMKKYNIPSTVYLTTSFIDKNPRYSGLLWTDYIYSILQSTAKKTLDLSEYGLGCYNLGSSHERYVAKGEICRALKELDYENKNSIIDGIEKQLESSAAPADIEIFGGLDWDDIKTACDEGLMEFGAHTVNHEILTMLPPELMKREILESRKIIEEKIGKPVRSFAYPNGTYNRSVRETVAAHFESALAAAEGLNKIGGHVHEIRRINIYNGMTMREFKLAISGASHFISFLTGIFKGNRSNRAGNEL